MLSKKRKEQEQRNLLKKANESCQALDELFENSAPEEKVMLFLNERILNLVYHAVINQ